MCRIFSRCTGAVVTARTRTGHTAVIEMRRRPCARRMTQIATRIRRDMARRFTGRDRAVMATRTRTRHL